MSKKVIEQLFPDFVYVNSIQEDEFISLTKVKRKSDNKQYAIKIYYLKNQNQEDIQKLIHALNKISNIQSPYIVKIYEASYNKELTYIAQNIFQLNYISSFITDNHDICIQKKYSEQEIWMLLHRVSKALNIFHKCNLVHGNITFNNIFSPEIKLGLPNIRYLLKYQSNTVLCPEYIKDQIYNKKSDLYQLGLMLYEIMYSQPPFVQSNQSVLQKKMLNYKIVSVNPQYSYDLNQLLKILMANDHELRCDTESLISFCEQKLFSDEDNQIRQLLPKKKYFQLFPPTKKSKKRQSDINNTIYFQSPYDEDKLMTKFYFKPSKIKSQSNLKHLSSKPNLNEIEFDEPSKQRHIPKLPKILREQYIQSKIVRKISDNLNKSFFEDNLLENTTKKSAQNQMKTTKTFPKNVAYNTLSKISKSNESIIFMHQVAEQAKKRAGRMLVSFKFE